MVDQEEQFDSVFNKFCTWLEDELKIVGNTLPGHHFNGSPKFTFVTCGDWDLNYMLPNQCSTSQIILPDYFRQWINVKKSFAMSSGAGKFPRSLSEMLNDLGLVFDGRPHSGIDDVKNIVKIVQTLSKERCYVFENTTSKPY